MSSNSTDSPRKYSVALGFESIHQFSNENALQSFEQKLCTKILASRKANWKKRAAALEIIEKICIDSLEYPVVNEYINHVLIKNENVKDMAFALIEQIQDNRSEIIKQTSLTMQALATAMNRRFVKIARKIFPQLLKCIGRSEKVIRSHADNAIICIIKHVHSDKLIFLLFDAFDSTKNMEVQEHCCCYFQIILQNWPTLNESLTQKIETFLRNGLKGKSKKTRHCTASSVWFYFAHFPNRQKIFLSSLEPRLKTTVMNAQNERKKSFIKPISNKHKNKKAKTPKRRTSDPMKKIIHHSLPPNTRRSQTLHPGKQNDNNTDSMDSNEINNIFNVNFRQFELPNTTKTSNEINECFEELTLDVTATELHTEWKFFRSQISDSLICGNGIMQKLKNKEDMHSIEEMINLFERQRDKIDFIVHRFRNAQTECADIDSCEL